MNFTDKIFVFVVCGEKKHIDTLHFSLRYLNYFSSLTNIVITDSTRNEVPVLHKNVIDIKTPVHFNNHQASIWLKTSLHNILPKGHLYCYLDSDIIAVSHNCDEIFNHFQPPIIFAADHCRMQQFSPYALNCNCSKQFLSDKSKLKSNISKVVNLNTYPPDYTNPNIRQLFSTLQQIKDNPLNNILPLIKFLLSFFKTKVNIKNQVFLHQKKKLWYIGKERFPYPFLFAYRKAINKNTGYKFNLHYLECVNPEESKLAKNSCNHLTQAIKSKFNLEITNPNWQHWNGGVFLFNDESHEFIETWHRFTMQIFKDKYWKTRDQGTLIAVAWKFGLQNHPVLPEEFNFIADYYKWNIQVKPHSNPIEIIKNNKSLKPYFFHIYHEFGNKKWDLWQEITKLQTM